MGAFKPKLQEQSSYWRKSERDAWEELWFATQSSVSVMYLVLGRDEFEIVAPQSVC